MPSSFDAFTDQTRPLALLDDEAQPPRPSWKAQLMGVAGMMLGAAAVLGFL